MDAKKVKSIYLFVVFMLIACSKATSVGL